MSRRRFRFSLLALMVVLLVLPFWIFREPSYAGRGLSEWLADLESGRSRGQERSEAVEAIRAIGPKGVPRLVEMLVAKESFLAEIHRHLRNEFLRADRRIPAPWQLQNLGCIGLEVLGPAASNAVPDIIAMLEQNPERMELWALLEKIGPSSVRAAQLLERAFFGPGAEAKEKEWVQSDFHPIWIASDLRMAWGKPHTELLRPQLLEKTNGVVRRVSALWSLRKDPELARNFIPIFITMASDRAESAMLRIACMHALGRIPNLESSLIEPAIRSYENDFGPLPFETIMDGDFSGSVWLGTNEPPTDPKAPSLLYTNWLTWKGVVGRNLSPAWGTGLKIELGPRTPGGAISQVFRTINGHRYEVQFEASIGRNVRMQLTVGDLDVNFAPDSNNPMKPAKLVYYFRANSPLTTLTFSAPEHQSYGPFLDHVEVTPKEQ